MRVRWRVWGREGERRSSVDWVGDVGGSMLECLSLQMGLFASVLWGSEGNALMFFYDWKTKIRKRGRERGVGIFLHLFRGLRREMEERKGLKCY